MKKRKNPEDDTNSEPLTKGHVRWIYFTAGALFIAVGIGLFFLFSFILDLLNISHGSLISAISVILVFSISGFFGFTQLKRDVDFLYPRG